MRFSNFLLSASLTAPLWSVIWVVTDITPASAQTAVDLHPEIHIITAVKGISVIHDGAVPVSAAAGAQLRAGDRLTTGPDSRADIQLDPDNMLAAGPNTEFHIALLANYGYRLDLTRGEITYRMLSAYAADAKVETPIVSVRPGRVGAYRITVTRDGESEIVPESNDIEVVASSGSQWVGPGWKMIVRGTAANPEFKVVSAISWWKRAATLMSALQIGSSVIDAISAPGHNAPRAGLRPSSGHIPQPPSRPHEPASGHPHESTPASSHAPAAASSHTSAPAASSSAPAAHGR